MAHYPGIFGRKRKLDEEGPALDKDFWLLTFSDLLQLLLTFFVLLFAMASMDNKMIKEMFRVFTGAIGALNFSEKTQVLPPSIKPMILPPTFQAQDFVLFLRLEQMRFETRIPAEKELADIVSSIEIGGVEVSRRGKDFSLLMPEDALFEDGGVRIRENFKEILKKISSILSLGKNSIMVEGHTDDLVHRSELYNSNWELSIARATAVRNYLLELGEIEEGRIEAKGRASYRPKVKNLGEAYRKRNRRVEILIRQYADKSF